MTAADNTAEALPKAEKLARAMENVMSGGRAFNRQLAAQARDELRASQAQADAQAQEIAKLRAENERLRNLDHVFRWNEAFSPTHQHKKRGSTYELLGTARIQSDEPLSDMAAVEVYIGRGGDLWARRQSEFHDGRFTALTPSPETAP